MSAICRSLFPTVELVTMTVQPPHCPSRLCATALALAAVLLSCGPVCAATALEEGFRHPPDSAKPHTWWHWMNGNITAEGITADLEAMKAVGLGGAQIFDVTDGILPGPVKYLSPEWRALVKHAIQEADRLGLEICMHNCAGWSSSGGPWVKPEHAMQMLVVTEKRVRGPARLDEVLPQPLTRAGYYRDAVVLAFPTPAAEANTVAELNPTITSSAPELNLQPLFDGNPDTQVVLPPSPAEKPQYIQFELTAPCTVRALTIAPGWGRGGARVELQVSDDGTTFRTATAFHLREPWLTRAPMAVTFEPVTARVFRLAFPAERAGGRPALAELTLETGFRISDWAAKAGYTRANPAPQQGEVPRDVVTSHTEVRDITSHMDPTGRLRWDVPPGNWTILRMGHTPTGKDNHPAPEEGRGLECDKLSREAVTNHFEGMLGKIIADIGPLAGKTLKHVLIDSYEVDCQNWTPRMREEFAARRGYDPLPFLPVLTGRVVDSLEASERFLWDFRRTIADLYADNYWGCYAELCHAHGMQLSTEPYGNGNFDDLTCGGRADIPMSEFWAGQGNDSWCAKLASSVAHTYGRKPVGAEAFTAEPSHGKWQNHPYSLKALGDFMYCAGVNRFIFHRYAHQPWMNLWPGMTMGPHGMHFERTITWWKQAPAWLQYLSRCQYLLQEGLFVADLCYLVGEGSPTSPPGRGSLRPPPPPGYDYDACDAQVLLTRMSVHDGRLVLPDGMSYRLLVLPDSEAMTPTLLRKVRELVREGGTVIGARPTRSPSLQGYPDCDREVQALAEDLWGDCDGRTVTEHAYGQGAIVWGRPLQEVLEARGILPDFSFVALKGKADIQYIHRRIGETDVYFVSSQSSRTEAVECSFRVTGKAPQLWHPDTGVIEPAPIFRQEGGRTVVPLRLDPVGSVFVVFPPGPVPTDPPAAFTRDGQRVLALGPQRKHTLEIRRAVYGVLRTELPDCVDVTAQVAALVRNGTLSVAATNALAGDPAPNVVKQMRVDYVLDGVAGTKIVDENETLTIPEDPAQAGGELEIRRAIYGILPPEPMKPPGEQTVDVTAVLAGMVRDGTLSVAATNALAGDPAYLIVKQMRVDYIFDGREYSRTVNENEVLEIPSGFEEGVAPVDFPAAELTLAEDGAPIVTAWDPGAYQVQTARGKTLRFDVTALPEQVVVQGPWEVRFPPNWGAPEKATFDKLVSWTDHGEPGIKYFSGTATYAKDLDIPAELMTEGLVLALDLGVVREIAEVRLNDTDLGVLWKPPFRVDITRVARPGPNSLEVRVTNMWTNRLIGDEQFPDDCEWNPGGDMRAWPQWLLEGRPRPPTGRFTFTTWKHYNRNSPLLPSGLLGPVTLRAGRVVRLPGE